MKPRKKSGTHWPFIVWASVVGLVLIGLAAWIDTGKSSDFGANVALMVAGIPFSLAAAVFFYDRFQQKQRSRLWTPMRREVFGTLARRVCFLVWEIHVYLDPGTAYLSWGAALDRFDREPGNEGLVELDREIETLRKLTHLVKAFDRGYQIPTEDDPESFISGERMWDALNAKWAESRSAELRSILAPLVPVADESAHIFVALENLLVAVLTANRVGIGQRAGEPDGRDFLVLFDDLLSRIRALYVLLLEEWEELPAPESERLLPAPGSLATRGPSVYD